MAPAVPTTAPGPSDLVKRQTIVTLTVSASSAATSAATASKKESFPIAIAIPALVGGMAAAILGALLYWWISKRRRAERQRAREAYERRRRKRANTAASSARPSLSSDRRPSSDQKSPIKEKGYIPPVPVLPKHAKAQYTEGKYGAYHDHREHADGGYNTQPSIDEQNGADPYSPTAPLTAGYDEGESDRQDKKQKSPPRASRSTARVAAAENAAEKAFGDPMTRYNPKKPSPLALKAQEANLSPSPSPAANNWGESAFRGGPTSPTRAVTADSQRLSPGPTDARTVSGEWGVALGSSNNDTSVHAQMTQQQQRTSYSDDPYLNSRAKSGLYSSDPYAAYHDDDEEEIDYHRVAGNMGLGDGTKGRNWV